MASYCLYTQACVGTLTSIQRPSYGTLEAGYLRLYNVPFKMVISKRQGPNGYVHAKGLMNEALLIL